MPAITSLSLADLEGHDATTRSSGIERRFLCPLLACKDHQNPRLHRSLTLNTQTGAWNCKRCHAKGLLTEWHTRQADRASRPFVSSRDRDRNRLRSLLDVPAPRRVAVATVPDDLRPSPALGSLLADIKPLPGTAGAQYLERRGLSVDSCQAAGVRFSTDYFGRPAAIFPLRDSSGRVVALHGRYTDGRTALKSRTKGSMAGAVFATPNAWSGDPWGGRVVVTEAPIDALTLALCGVPAIALCGTSGGRELLRERLALKQVIAAFDNDIDAAENAGQKAGRALAELLLPFGGQVFMLLPPNGMKDWNQALQTIGADALRAYLRRELAPVVFIDPPGPIQKLVPTTAPVNYDVTAADFADLVPLAREAEAAADAIRYDAMRAVLAAAECDRLPVVPVTLRPGHTCDNPNKAALVLLKQARAWAHTPSGKHHALNALDDLETMAWWWREISKPI